MTEHKLHNGRSLRHWFSRKLPNMVGVSYTLCTPVIAGLPKFREDLVGRSVDFDKPPLDTVIYNVVPDEDVSLLHKEWELDYVLGDSDAAMDDDDKLSHGTLIYWTPLKNTKSLEFDDAIIVKVIGTNVQSDEAIIPNEVDGEWLCLRRVGSKDHAVHDRSGKIHVRSKSSFDGKVLPDKIDPDSVVGIVFGSHKLERNFRVHMAPSLPFAEPV